MCAAYYERRRHGDVAAQTPVPDRVGRGGAQRAGGGVGHVTRCAQ